MSAHGGIQGGRANLTPLSIGTLRQELARAERDLRERAEREAILLAQAEKVAWLEAQANCLQLERIRRIVKARQKAIGGGSPEKFSGELELAGIVLRDVETWELRDSAAYTVISFANRRERLRFLRGGTGREDVLRTALAQGGVYTERRYFQEILR